ncbi:MAG: ABC transporter permease [Acidimicrobiia bacterium]
MARARAALRRVGNLWFLALLLVAWELYARNASTLFFPPFGEVFAEFRRSWIGEPSGLFLSDEFWHHGTASLTRFAKGWIPAAVGGIVVGVLLGRVPLLARMFNPVIRFSMAVPKAVFLPVALGLFGITDMANQFLIFISTVWIILVNTMDGVAAVDRAWLRSARSLRIGRIAFLGRVVLPAASPQILAGLRVSIGIGLIVMVVSELYATTAGLGYQILVYQRTFQYVQMWSSFVLIGLIGITVNGLFSLAEHRLLHWQRRPGLAEA